VKIDRNKLNTLLRSGLNPEIKTRKQLAAHLSLDPTSLTRWFSSRDRLGNPRYPVVPDRHVTKIFQLFNLDPQSLNLDDETFRQYCFENSLNQTNLQNELEQKKKLRLEQALQRKLDITDYPTEKNSSALLAIITIIVLLFLGGYFINNLYFNELNSIDSKNNLTTQNSQCWTGYSPSLGVFKQEDKADPCHYGKLFHNALIQLKAENNSMSLSNNLTEDVATHTYINFLFEQLETRRIQNNITLNIELGKSEMHRSNFQKAQSYFSKANEMLTSLPKANPRLLTEITIYTEKIAKKSP